MRIVIRQDSKRIRQQAARFKVDVVVSDAWDLEEPTLFVGDASIPWALLSCGFGFLERWDAAAPLWRYNVTSADLGSTLDRERTESVTHDLRIPVYAPELLFVRDSELGRELLDIWRQECDEGADERLAFVRALYSVKPRFCALPQGWLLDPSPVLQPVSNRLRRERKPGLIQVEIIPGCSVCCRPGQEDMWRERLLNNRVGRRAT